MKITKQQYLDSLEIVTKYHECILNNQIKVRLLSKPKTRDFINNHGNEMSKHLYNILDYAVTEAEKNEEYNSYRIFLNVENLTFRNCIKLRNFGKKTWVELDTLFNKYFN